MSLGKYFLTCFLHFVFLNMNYARIKKVPNLRFFKYILAVMFLLAFFIIFFKLYVNRSYCLSLVGHGWLWLGSRTIVKLVAAMWRPLQAHSRFSNTKNYLQVLLCRSDSKFVSCHVVQTFLLGWKLGWEVGGRPAVEGNNLSSHKWYSEGPVLVD